MLQILTLFQSYSSSSQLLNWLLTADELNSRRQDCNISTRKRLTEQFRSKAEALGDVEILPTFLTAEEELIIVKRNIFAMHGFYQQFDDPQLPADVFGFAATYLKRFYLNNSVMDYSPREMMLTALYLAFKAADYPISLNRFVDHIPRNRERYHAFISRSELFLMDKLLYDLWIYPPYRPLVGFLVELIAFRQSKDSSMTDEVATELMNSLRKEGYEIINTWFQTDLCFTNPPSQYALAVVMELGRRHPELQTADFVSTVVLGDVTAEDGDEESVEQKKERLWDKLEAIQTMISEFDFIVDLSVGLELENVLAECRNPLYDIDSDDYKEIQRQAMERMSFLD
nr:cyclin [Hymenolepis microstoma]